MSDIQAIEPLILSTVDMSPPQGRRFWLDDSMFPPNDDTGMHYPRFSVQEVSKVFFGQGPDWLRWRMRPDKPSRRKCRECRGSGEVPRVRGAGTKACKPCKGEGVLVSPPTHPHGFFILDGKPLEAKRLLSTSDDPNKNTARYYTLADVEKMVHALADQRIIDGLRMAHIILMLRCCARLYGSNGGYDLIVEPPLAAEENAG